MPRPKCHYTGCNREASYDQGWWEDGRSVWGPVCATHDRLVGRMNLMRLAGMTLHEAISFDTFCRLTRGMENPQTWEAYLSARKARK